MLEAATPLRFLPGVGPTRAAALAPLGFETIEDLLYHFPFRYEDRRAFASVAQLDVDDERSVSVSVEIVDGRLIRTRRRNFSLVEATVRDDSGSLRVVWYNQRYLVRALLPGRRLVLFGRPTRDRSGRTVLENPDHEFLEGVDADAVHTGRIVPVYRKLGNFSSRALRQLVHRGLGAIDPASLPEWIPAETRRRHELVPRFEALSAAHFPADTARLDDLAARTTPALHRLAFEEIFLLQLALALRRREARATPRGRSYRLPTDFRRKLAALLPFRLTPAQRRVLREIGADLRGSLPMRRLLQGDVGSGKTIVAVLTLLVAVENGYQAALMAPTEILADQHYRQVGQLLAASPVPRRVVLLTGSMRAPERRRALQAIASGEAEIVIGTHALFESTVEFAKLGLVVIDEQHRFGVLQRVALTDKGSRTDVLVMTATPIPRSLALTLYGDLDLSVLDELPPGRTPVRTVVRSEAERERVYAALRTELARGRQAYIVVPLVEESERSDLRAAEALVRELRKGLLVDIAVGMLHGRLKPGDKDDVMQRFVRGDLRVLVATTVIEVGVDVPNATVMIIEHAERFGLSQLHQLRGRVGRGSARSYCVLLVGSEAQGIEARERLRIMEGTTDGFKIAQRDFELRGSGAIFGTQQHGLSDLQFLAVMLRAPGLVESARREAQRLIERDADGGAGPRRLLAGLGRRWQRRLDLAHAG